MKVSLIALALAAGISSAQAADLGKAPADRVDAVEATPERFSFTGFYVGVQGGYGIANHTTNVTSTEHFDATPSRCFDEKTASKTYDTDHFDDPETEAVETFEKTLFKSSGFSILGLSEAQCLDKVHAFGVEPYETWSYGKKLEGTQTTGYDAAVPEHDVITKSKFDSNDSGAVGGILVGVDKQFGRFVVGVFGEYNWADLQGHDGDWAINGRAGFLLSQRLLAYGRVGYGQADYDDATYSGWKVGGGLEYALTENVSLGSVYTYQNYDQETVVNTPGLVVKDEFDEHRIMVDLKIKLNGGLLGN